MNEKVIEVEIKELDIKECLLLVRQSWSRIVFVSLIVVLITMIYVLNIPNVYRSDVLLTQANKSNSSGLTSLINQFGGLASIAGINPSSFSSSESEIPIEIMKSRSFISSFLSEYKLEPSVIASTGWDSRKNELIFDEDIFDSARLSWTEESDYLENPTVRAWDAYELFLKKNLIVKKDNETGLVRVSIRSYSPYLAQKMLKDFISELNNVIREREIEEANKSIKYLFEALDNTINQSHKNVFFQLIEKQEQAKMLAEIRTEYAFKIIDPAVVPMEEESPKRLLLVLVSLVLSIFLSSAYVIFSGILKRTVK